MTVQKNDLQKAILLEKISVIATHLINPCLVWVLEGGITNGWLNFSFLSSLPLPSLLLPFPHTSFFFPPPSSSSSFFSSQYWPRRCSDEELYNISRVYLHLSCPLVKKRSLDCARAGVPECGASPQLRAEERGIESRNQTMAGESKDVPKHQIWRARNETWSDPKQKD